MPSSKKPTPSGKGAQGAKKTVTTAIIVVKQPKGYPIIEVPTRPADKSVAVAVPDKKESNAFNGPGVPRSMQRFPKYVIKELTRLVHLGQGPSDCLKWIRLNYKGPVHIPSLRTIKTWQRVTLNRLEHDNDLRLEIEKYMHSSEINLAEFDPRDRKALLQGTIELMVQRIEHIGKLNKNLGDPRYEKIITENIQTIRAISHTLNQMETQEGLSPEVVQIISDTVGKHLMDVYMKAYRAVHGEAGVEDLGKQIKSLVKGLNMEAIEQEILNMVRTREREEKKRV